MAILKEKIEPIKLSGNIKLFEYDQNNPSGYYDNIDIFKDHKPNKVYIEADTEENADSIAESLGIYFNGVEDGIDCDCCGDRWYGIGSIIEKQFIKNICLDIMFEPNIPQ